MKNDKSSISKVRSYKEIAEFWDAHDLADYWKQTKCVDFEVDIQSELNYYASDNKLSAKVIAISRKRAVSPHTLLNLWAQEKLQEQSA